MKTTVQHFAPVLLAIVIICHSFKPAQRNCLAKGGGIADGIHFSFDAVKQKDGAVVGHIEWGDDSYSLACAKWFGNCAILYTTDGKAFMVVDNGERQTDTDRISEPIPGNCGDLLNSSDFFGIHNVTSGNIQVRE